MWLPTTLLLVFFAGAKTEKLDIRKCKVIMEELMAEKFTALKGEERLIAECTTYFRGINCFDDLLRAKTGFGTDFLSVAVRGRNIGKVATLAVNFRNAVRELCTNGSELRQEYLQDIDCRCTVELETNSICSERAKHAYEAFKASEKKDQEGDGDKFSERCIKVAYEFGCLGAMVQAQCGDRALETAMKINRKIGIFRVGLCSEATIAKAKTDFLDRQDMDPSQRDLYRQVILSMQ